MIKGKSEPKSDTIAKIQTLQKQFKKVRSGYREDIRRITCEAYKVAIKIRKSSTKKKNFCELAGIRRRVQLRKGFDIARSVMVYVMGARTKSQLQLAWKRTRAVQYLHDDGVKLIDLEAEIRKRGGLESVAREAAKKDPRRKPPPLIKLAGRKPKGFQEEDDDDDEDVVGTFPKASFGRNDGPTTIVVELNASDLDHIRKGTSAGQKIGMIVTRGNLSSPNFRLIKVTTA